MLRARLDAEGIPASVADDRHAIMNWPISLALGGARLQVPAEFLDPAREVLAAYNSGEFERDLLDCYPDAVEACPQCGSGKITRSVSMRQRILVIVTTVVASAPFPARRARMRCLACGHRWKHDD